MVSYQKFTSIGYDVAEEKGLEVSGPGTQQNSRDLVAVIASIWNDRKEELNSATIAEAKNIARQEINVD